MDPVPSEAGNVYMLHAKIVVFLFDARNILAPNISRHFLARGTLPGPKQIVIGRTIDFGLTVEFWFFEPLREIAIGSRNWG